MGRGAQDQTATREPLADVVVGVAVEAQGDAAGQEGPEALPGGAAEADVDGPLRQAGATVATGDLGAEHGADRAVDVADGPAQRDPLGVVERRCARLDQLDVEGPGQAVVLGRDAAVGRRRRPPRARAGSG